MIIATLNRKCDKAQQRHRKGAVTTHHVIQTFSGVVREYLLCAGCGKQERLS